MSGQRHPELPKRLLDVDPLPLRSSSPTRHLHRHSRPGWGTIITFGTFMTLLVAAIVLGMGAPRTPINAPVETTGQR